MFSNVTPLNTMRARFARLALLALAFAWMMNGPARAAEDKAADPASPGANPSASASETQPTATGETNVNADAAKSPAQTAMQEGGHGEVALPTQAWPFSGPFGTYDRASLQRGYKVYREVCSACHSMKRVYFRNLEALGYKEGQIKNIASQYEVTDGPNDEGEMFKRKALPSDHFISPYANDSAAKASNNGALPPDLSLITKARHGGADYVFGVLTGFEKPPAGTKLMNGQYWNLYKPGHVIAMPPPLADGQVQYEDGSPQTLHQYAYDVANFLTWAADPYMEERKQTGIKVLIFLGIFAGLMYAVKRRIWSKVH